MNTLQGVSIAALHKGLLSVGVKDNEVLVFSELMDAKSLFLTANADTVYSMGVLDLTKGPMVLEVPPKALGAIDDYWFRWVIDIGLPGPDRGEGGKYLILPPGYDGPLPEGGFFIARARTNRRHVVRSLVPGEQSDPKPVAESIKKVHQGLSLRGRRRRHPHRRIPQRQGQAWPVTPPPPTVFHEGTGKVMNTIPPNDFSYYEMLNEIVQQEPATSLDAELMGPIAAIGIVKGKPFAPDARMKKILTEALALANATSRTLFMSSARSELVLLPRFGLAESCCLQTGYEFETPIPDDYARGRQALPAHRLPHAGRADVLLLRRHRHHARRWPCACPALARSTCWTMVDADKEPFDGAKTYKVTLPKDIPQANFWSFTLYDNHDALDARHAAALPARGQPELSVTRRRSGRRRHDDGLLRPDAARGRQTGQLDPDHAGKGLFPDACGSTARSNRSSPRTWRPSEVELVK